jgi:16S rRNA (cytosine1402-N4)-methyltransferase
MNALALNPAFACKLTTEIPAALGGAWGQMRRRALGWLQTGIWPWFGNSDGLEDLMPWGRGTYASRPSGDPPGNGQPPECPEAASRSMPFYHLPVLIHEVVEFLQPAPGKLIYDGTLGGGGHSEALLQRGARIVAMDQDENALAYATERLRPYADRFCALRGNFRDFPTVLSEAGVTGLDGMLIDIGVSSHHLDAAERGFSFSKEGPLDMRMDLSAPMTAADLVNTAPVEDLEAILREYGEEPQARRMAQAIGRARAKRPILTTLQLATVIAEACPKHGKRHPATQAFQALRIAVNDELGALRDFLQEAPRWLKPGGRIAVITFHSLEDRIVKQALQRLSTRFLDRPEWPEPRPNPECLLSLVTRKPVEASANEVALNPRARSARLRVAQRLPS